jgi:serine/threonine-protein kinase
MGVVYKARDPRIGRIVAIKTISNLSQDPEEARAYRDRFFLEARAAGRLLHPGIVQIFDVAEEQETQTPYIVMEFVSGQPLSRVLTGGGRVSAGRALQLVQEVTEALAYAHVRGVVHRDIKPENILVSDEGHPKIADFGVARLDSSSHTTPGLFLGTPAYMAPEQITGGAVDGRTDLFSLGVILYVMLSGHRPFQGTSARTIGFKLLHSDPVPVAAFDLNFSPELNYVVARCLAKSPEDRYQNGRDLARDIEDLLQGREPKRCRIPAADLGLLPQAAVQLIRDQGPVSVAPSNNLVNDSLGSSVGVTAQLESTAPPVPRRIPHEVYARAVILAASLVLAYWCTTMLLSWSTGLRNPVLARIAIPAMGAGRAAKSKPSQQQRGTAQQQRGTPQRSGATVLHLDIQHQFEEARISIWVDDRLAYTASVRGEVKKRFPVFQRASKKTSPTIQVPAGDHRLRVRLQAGQTYAASETLNAKLQKDSVNILHIKAENRRKLQLRMERLKSQARTSGGYP